MTKPLGALTFRVAVLILCEPSRGAGFPACRLERTLPGGTRPELNDSLELVRQVMTPNWDIHFERVTPMRPHPNHVAATPSSQRV
jgi:hypothetical protein